MREWVSSWESWGEDVGLPGTEEQRSENMDEIYQYYIMEKEHFI